MERAEKYKLWIEYLKESNVRKDKGDEFYFYYMNQLEEASKGYRAAVKELPDILEDVIDRSYWEAVGDCTPDIPDEPNPLLADARKRAMAFQGKKNLPFDAIKKRLMWNFENIAECNLILLIDCAAISPRGGVDSIVKEIKELVNKKTKTIADFRGKFYIRWSEPSEECKIVPEIRLYLQLYQKKKEFLGQGRKRLCHEELLALPKIVKKFYKDHKTGGVVSDLDKLYNEERQINRAIGYAKKIIKNVENGYFPGRYRI